MAENPPPPRMRENFLASDLSISGNSINFGFVAENPPPPRLRENFLASDLSISGNFDQLWFLWQKSPPPPQVEWKFLDFRFIHFRQISSNFGFLWQKTSPQGEGRFFGFRFIHFRQFRVTLVFVAEKPPPRIRENFSDFRFIHFRQFWATLVFVAEKPPPLPPRMRENFLTSDLSISGNFEWLWFLWQKTPPPPMRENFLTSDWSISGNLEQLWFLWQKRPPPYEGKYFDFRFIHFRQFRALWFLWQKSTPPPGWGKIFWLQIYPFQVISSNFGFCGRKAPPSRMRENILTSDLSISGHFEQLWFLWQKIPPPPSWMRENIFDFRFIHFRQFRATLVFVAEKPPPTRMRENFLTSDLSISGNFEQLWFLWQKSPPPQDKGKFFDFRFIHFRQFWATLVFVAENLSPGWGKIFWLQIYPFQAISEQLWFFVAEKPPPPGWVKIFWLQIYPFQAISSNFGFCGRKAPTRMRENFFDFRLIHFRQFWATLVSVAEKPPPPPPGWRENFFGFRFIHFRQFLATLVFVAENLPPGWGKIFWLQIYPFQAISSNFGFCGRKASPPQDEGKILDFRFIHFRQFWATLVFVVENLPPGWGKNFLTSDLSIFRQFRATLVFVAEKPPPRMREIFLASDLSISGNF